MWCPWCPFNPPRNGKSQQVFFLDWLVTPNSIVTWFLVIYFPVVPCLFQGLRWASCWLCEITIKSPGSCGIANCLWRIVCKRVVSRRILPWSQKESRSSVENLSMQRLLGWWVQRFDKDSVCRFCYLKTIPSLTLCKPRVGKSKSRFPSSNRIPSAKVLKAWKNPQRGRDGPLLVILCKWSYNSVKILSINDIA